MIGAAILVMSAPAQVANTGPEHYGLKAEHGKMLLRDFPGVNGSADAARKVFPSAYAYMTTAHHWSPSMFLDMSVASAFAVDAVWQGHTIEWTKPCISRTNVDWSKVPGEWWFTWPAPICMGQYTGAGPHQGVHAGHAATVMRVWRDKWQGDAHEMNAMQTTSWGLDGNEGWVHGFSVQGFGFVGDRSGGWHDPRYTASGLAIWDAAEASSVGNIWSTNWNGYGVKLVRGTPFTASTVMSVFENTLGGVGILDGSLGTFTLGTVSGDDNSALVVMDSQYGRPAGGMVSWRMGKSESGHREPKGMGQVILWQKAPCAGAVSVDMAQLAMLDRYLDAAFVMNSGEWGQTLMVSGFVGWNFHTLVHDVRNGKRWGGASYRPYVFAWSDRDGGTLADLVALKHLPSEPVNAADRLGTVSNNGVFDYANGKPAFSITGGAAPPPRCTGWSSGDWGACIDGVRTREALPSPAECTGTPPTAKPETIEACAGADELDRTRWVIKSSYPEHSKHEALDMMRDGIISTRWTSGAPAAVGGWISVDISATGKPWRRWVIDATGSDADHPSAIAVDVSSNGSTWTTLTAAQAKVTIGTRTTIETSSARTGRYVRFRVTGGGSKWWSVHELRGYTR